MAATLRRKPTRTLRVITCSMLGPGVPHRTNTVTAKIHQVCRFMATTF